MPALHLYDKLLQSPLFLGMSKEDLNDIVEHTRLGFSKYEEGKVIVKEGQLCNKMYYLTDGSIILKKSADDKSYCIEEVIHAPYLFQLEHLFGLAQRHSNTYTALSNCNFISIDKDELLKLSDKFFIFKLNMINLLSAQTQKLMREPWRKHPDNLRALIIRFVRDHCSYPAGRKRVNIHMEVLAKELNDGRLNVSRELNKMAEAKLIVLHRGGFDIPALERLLM